MNILITKTLTTQQKDWLSASFNDFLFFEEAVINSYPHTYQQFVNNCVDKLNTCEQWVFTSRNAVNAIASFSLKFPDTVYAVGAKTAEALQALSCKASIPPQENALGLASYIIEENVERKKMAFFCGNLRRDELPKALKEAKIPLEELEVYTTEAFTKKLVPETYNTILFFSPSAVNSYAEHNSFPEHIHYIAIGPTTTEALRKHKIKTIHTANTPSLEKMMDIAAKLK